MISKDIPKKEDAKLDYYETNRPYNKYQQKLIENRKSHNFFVNLNKKLTELDSGAASEKICNINSVIANDDKSSINEIDSKRSNSTLKIDKT